MSAEVRSRGCVLAAIHGRFSVSSSARFLVLVVFVFFAVALSEYTKAWQLYLGCSSYCW